MTWLTRVLVVLALIVPPTSAAAGTTPGIVGGDSAGAGHPWVVALIDQRNRQFCAGSLIKPDTVVTAAHCLLGRSADGLLVLGGRSDLSRVELGEAISQVTRIDVPGRFESAQVGNDIATLTLQTPFPFQPIPVAGAADADLYTPGTVGTVLGWGRGAPGQETSELRQLTVPVVATDRCRDEYDALVTGASYDATTMFCAGFVGQGKGVCTGDAGGPLVIDGKLAGIVSWNVGCGGYPDFYTKVAAF